MIGAVDEAAVYDSRRRNEDATRCKSEDEDGNVIESGRRAHPDARVWADEESPSERELRRVQSTSESSFLFAIFERNNHVGGKGSCPQYGSADSFNP